MAPTRFGLHRVSLSSPNRLLIVFYLCPISYATVDCDASMYDDSTLPQLSPPTQIIDVHNQHDTIFDTLWIYSYHSL